MGDRQGLATEREHLYLSPQENAVASRRAAWSKSNLKDCRNRSLVLPSAVLMLAIAGCAGIPNRPPRLEPSSYGCMRAVIREKLPADLPEKRAHCVGTGLIARYCSVSEAHLAGTGKELKDLLGRGDAEASDLRANRAGIACARAAENDQGLARCCTERGY
jgi:hypothetical protein